MIAVVTTVLLYATISCVASSGQQVYYVAPQGSCPPSSSTPCHPLDYYAAHSSQYFTSHSEFQFAAGMHSLQYGTKLTISNVSNLTLRATGEERATVSCGGSGTFTFQNASMLNITNMGFTSCGCLSYDCWSLLFDSVHNLTISKVVVENTTGYGLLVSHMLGKTQIQESIFQYNYGVAGDHDILGGNAVFLCICEDPLELKDNPSMLFIQSSVFQYGQNPMAQFSLPGASGITLVIQCYNVHIFLDNVTINSNSGVFGISFMISHHVYTNTSVTVRNSYIMNGVKSSAAGDTGGGGLYILDQVTGDQYSCGTTLPNKDVHLLVYFLNTTFIHNSVEGAPGGGVQIDEHLFQNHQCSPQLIVFDNCTFSENEQDSGSACYFKKLWSYVYGQSSGLQVLFKNCTFFNNSGGSTISLINVNNATFINSTLIANRGRAIYTELTSVTFGGHVTFQDNYGGGLSLCLYCFMFYRTHTQVDFVRNHASNKGGGIYVASEDEIDDLPLCFFDFAPDVEHLSLDTVKITMVNNTAPIAGSAIYGGQLDCQSRYFTLQNTFSKIFSIAGAPGDASLCASDPFAVRLCKSGIVQVYPGETFTISVAVISKNGGAVPGIANAQIANTSSSAYIDPSQLSRIVQANHCVPLEFTVFSQNDHEDIKLFVDSTRDLLPNNLSVTLKPCPVGFSISDLQMCNCIQLLTNHNVRCNISNKSFLRSSNLWIGYHHTVKQSTSQNETLIVVSRNCIHTYCTQKVVNITSNTTDLQCTDNHTGILCSQCEPNLSLSLGTLRCLQCSNTYLTLLLAFFTAGILLVSFLIFFNFTISQGTPSGLILYANFVGANSYIFFTPEIYKNASVKFLSVFIAWLNLDVGIETCFYNGLDVYAYNWLQFAFPAYVWSLVGAIVVLSWHFSVVAKLVGSNAVKVLATLLLLSYAKLQTTIINAFSFATLTYEDGSKSYAWLYDGSIHYGEGKHIPLLLVSGIVFILLVLPYTLALVFVQILQAMSNHCLCRWVNKLIPFFDAYTGCLRPRFRFWPGFLLLFRSVLFIAYTYGVPNVNMTVSVVGALTLLVMMACSGGVYKKWQHNLLEAFSLFNLGGLSVVTLYINSFTTTTTATASQSQTVAVAISVGLAFLVFVGICLFHLFTAMKSYAKCAPICTWFRHKIRQHERFSTPELQPLLNESPPNRSVKRSVLMFRNGEVALETT